MILSHGQTITIKSCTVELTLSPWHMPDDAIEGVDKHSSRLQPSNNLHAPVTPLMFSCSGTDVLPRRFEGSGKPCAVDRASLYIGTYRFGARFLGSQSKSST